MSSCSTPTPSRPARCAASATSPPTASASSPTSRRVCSHVLVNGTVIRDDGVPVAEALEQRPGRLLRT